ncbi:MAG: hypothetical protein O2942_11130 [Proteobacteria bacterium]|nr:hypothetical protein [Pseudomonadota bacterium]
MPAPEREYYYLDEVINHWGVSNVDIEYLIENGHLTACFFLLNVDVEVGTYEKTADGRYSAVSHEIIKYRGLHQLLPDDCRKIFRRGKTKIHYFHVGNPQEYCKIRKDNGITVQKSDLVIVREEKSRYETEYDFDHKKKNNVCSIVKSKSKTTFYQENDYHHIEYDELVFEFGMIQAKIIETLHIASKTNHQWVHCKPLLDKAGSTSTRIRDLFKSKKDWQKLILSDGKGKYRLNL